MKLYKYTIAIVGLLLSYSCSDFLEYRDKDKVIPSTLQQYNELIYGELIAKQTVGSLYNLEFMTDDLESFTESYSSDIKNDGRIRFVNYYTWAKETQITGEGDEVIDVLWETMYQKILMCNIIENHVNKIAAPLKEDILYKQRMLGEVQCIRAICYYYLVNTYADVYKDAAQAETAMGVPINNEVGIYDKTNVRESLAKVCEKIEEDLESAMINLSEGEQKNTIFRPNVDIVRLMQSRLFLMMHRYDEAIAVCDELITKTNKTIAPASFVSTVSYSSVPFISKSNPGILFSWWKRDSFYSSNYYAMYVNSKSLQDLYKDNGVIVDYRAKAFFGGEWASDLQKSRKKYNINVSGTMELNYRIEEAHFNKAEAMLLKNGANYSDAINIVNEVRAQRIKPTGELLNPTSQEEAWTMFKNEKRCEFCFEDIRWHDIRRWNESITHIYHPMGTPTEWKTYVLEAGSPNYVLPLPLDVQRKNDKIKHPARIDSKTISNL